MKTDDKECQNKDNGIRQAWIKEKPIYQIMLKDYAPENCGMSVFSYISGDIPRLAKAGIGTIWLTGLAKNEKGTTPFSVLDPLKIEERYGSKEELTELIKTAHARGLRLITDYIPNHVSKQSRLCALHPDWFLRDNAGGIVSATDRRGAWEWAGLAQFDFLNPQVIDYLREVGKFWLQFGFDGFRLDAPLALIKQRMIENWYSDRPDQVEQAFKEEFWHTFIREMKKINPYACFLAESFGGYRELLIECGADLTLDAGFSYLLYEVLKENAPPVKLINYLAESRGHQDSLVHYKDGHDIRDASFNGNGMEKLRYINAVEARMFGLLIAVLPGVPMFYNGEIEAVLGYAYSSSRACSIPWNNYDREMKSFYTDLLRLAVQPVFRKGSFIILKDMYGHSSNILAFGREYKEEKIVVAANLKNQPTKSEERDWFSPDLSDLIRGNYSLYGIKDVFYKRQYPDISGARLKAEGLSIGLRPGEVQILMLERK